MLEKEISVSNLLLVSPLFKLLFALYNFKQFANIVYCQRYQSILAILIAKAKW